MTFIIKYDKLLNNIILLAVLIIVQLILRLFCNSMKEYIKAKTAMQLRQYILKQIMNKEYANIEKYHSGELLNRMFSDVSVVIDGLTGILPALVGMITRLIGAAVVLMSLDTGFTLLFIAAGTVLFLVSRFFRGKIKHLHKNVQVFSYFISFIVYIPTKFRFKV